MAENLIEKTIREHILEKNAVFVFPTQIAADLWADRLIQTTEVTAVPMEKFMAWDKFKGEAVRGENQDKDPVPATMRSIFASVLIKKNAGNPFLKSLIVPEYAETAEGFANWIGSILPGLGLWKEYFDKTGGSGDDEDKDLEMLYTEYSAFLNKYNLFDPAWERPPFKDTGKIYYIFYPEINEDWEEYKKILEDSDKFIKLIKFENSSVIEGDVKLFGNARVEIKNVASVISALHREKGIEWSDIAVSVPDMDTYEPYIDRELSLMEIPHVTKNARPLGTTGAGCLFTQIKTCIDTENSYAAIKDLIFNRELPWKKQRLGEELIAFGQENHCICSFTYNDKKIDVWEKSLQENCTNQLVSNFYHSLNKKLKKFAEAKSFAELREIYFEFRNEFFDMEKCSEKSNSVLGRCISELSSLIDLEQKFKECEVPSVLGFFTDYLSRKDYLGQTEKSGVQLLKYKNAASAPFGCQVIVDASQRGTSVIYKDLGFLNEEKRLKLLKRTETNVSDKFIALYKMNSMLEEAYFTCSVRTLDGYSQATSYLNEVSLEKETDENILFPGNPYNSEKKWFLTNEAFPQQITVTEKESFKNWLKMQSVGELVQDKALTIVGNLEGKIIEDGKVKLSQSQLKTFYECPRKWLYKNYLSLEEQDNAAELMNKYASGSLYHKILELFCKNVREENLVLGVDETGELDEKFSSILNKAIDEAIVYHDNYDKNCFLKKELLNTTKQTITETIFECVKSFCKIFNNCKVAGAEDWFNVETETYRFSGRIDCLLQDNKNLQYYLVDFKNSAYSVPVENFYVQKDKKGEAVEIPEGQVLEEQRLPDFQMPTYVYLMENCDHPVKVENACFFNIKDAKCYPVFGEEMDRRCPRAKQAKDQSPLFNIDEFKPSVEKTLECVNRFVERVKNSDFSINENVQSFSVCFECEYSTICRKTFNVGKKD